MLTTPIMVEEQTVMREDTQTDRSVIEIQDTVIDMKWIKTDQSVQEYLDLES